MIIAVWVFISILFPTRKNIEAQTHKQCRKKYYAKQKYCEHDWVFIFTELVDTTRIRVSVSASVRSQLTQAPFNFVFGLIWAYTHIWIIIKQMLNLWCYALDVPHSVYEMQFFVYLPRNLNVSTLILTEFILALGSIPIFFSFKSNKKNPYESFSRMIDFNPTKFSSQSY